MSRESFDLYATNNAQYINEYSEAYKCPEECFPEAVPQPCVQGQVSPGGDRHVKYTRKAEALQQAQKISFSTPAHHRNKILYPQHCQIKVAL